MKVIVRRAVLLSLALIVFPVTASAVERFLQSSEWPQPASAGALLGLVPVVETLRDFEASDDGYLLVRYPGGQDGTTWAETLRDYLVALGVASDRVVLEVGAGRRDALLLQVLSGGRY